ncbi:prokaryotic type I DNA topoisomerase, partial [Linderina pennispora]
PSPIVAILSNGSSRTRNGCSKYNKNHDFEYRINGSFTPATMTSVLGHVLELDFTGDFRKWQACNPQQLFTAPLVTSTNEKLQDTARNGEGIGSEVRATRAHFSSAMQSPRELDMQLVAARIGSALTRFQTLRLQSRFEPIKDRLVSYGPCQFPTLGFVVDQFLRVERFAPEPFWLLFLEHQKPDGPRGHACFAIYMQCVQSPTVRIVSEKWRPLPLTTVELQTCCARFLRMSPDSIMGVAEGLYNQGFISYPRTETDQFDRSMDLQGTVAKLTQFQPLAAYAQRLVNGEFRWPRQGKNNDKAHPPIHPRVYEFITRRFLACCSDNAKGQATERWSESTGDTFTPTARPRHRKLLTEGELVKIMDRNGIRHRRHKIIDREYIFKGAQGLSPSTLGVGLQELRKICLGHKHKQDVVRETLHLYQAVYTKSANEIEKLELALGRCMGVTPTSDPAWQPNNVVNADVCMCPQCPGSWRLRARQNGSWMIGCDRYPQCRRAVWVPDVVENMQVSEVACSMCVGNPRGPAKLLEIVFRQGSVPPGVPTPYQGCVRGCDELISEMFGSNSGGGGGGGGNPALPNTAGRPVSHQNQLPPPSRPRLVTQKPGPNKGRAFFKCARAADAQCDFFHWADQPTNSSDLFPVQSRLPKPKCKCGLFASLKQTSEKDAEAYMEGALIQNAAGSQCYRCQQAGHWARDCPNAEPGGEGSSRKSAGGPGAQRQRKGKGKGQR